MQTLHRSSITDQLDELDGDRQPFDPDPMSGPADTLLAPAEPPVPPVSFGPPLAAFPPPLPPAPRRRGRRAAVSLAAIALVGGASGYAGSLFAQRTDTDAAAVATATTTAVATAATGIADTLSVGEIAAAVEPSVVVISADVTVQQGPFTQRGTSAGTGVILTADGEVLTNAHVVEGATSITVTLDDGTTYTATVVGTDEDADIALLQLEGASGLTPATLGDSDAVAVGDDVVAIGNALDLDGGLTVTRGIVSALDRTVEEETRTLSGAIQTDAAISSGNSGGPLVNAAGEVIGINAAGATSSGSVTAENIGFAIPIDTAMEVVERLRADA